MGQPAFDEKVWNKPSFKYVKWMIITGAQKATVP